MLCGTTKTARVTSAADDTIAPAVRGVRRAEAAGDDERQAPGHHRNRRLVVGQVVAEGPAGPPGAEGVLLHRRTEQEPADREQQERHPRLATRLFAPRERRERRGVREQHAEEHGRDVRHQDVRRHRTLEARHGALPGRDRGRRQLDARRAVGQVDEVLELSRRWLRRQRGHEFLALARERHPLQGLVRWVAPPGDFAGDAGRGADSHRQWLAGVLRAQQAVGDGLAAEHRAAAHRVARSGAALPGRGADGDRDGGQPEENDTGALHGPGAYRTGNGIDPARTGGPVPSPGPL